jgi:hypothetical protein
VSIAGIVDLLDGFPGWTTSFQPMFLQEQSRQANSVTRAKDFGTPLWRGTWQTRVLEPNELDMWRARLDALSGILVPFRGVHLARCYPILYPNGSWPTGASFSGACSVASASGQSLALSGLPTGYTVSQGDMIGVTTTDNAWLFRALATVTAPAGTTPSFKVVPPIPAGLAAGQAASVKRPWCPMTLVPGAPDDGGVIDGTGTISFTATEMR